MIKVPTGPGADPGFSEEALLTRHCGLSVNDSVNSDHTLIVLQSLQNKFYSQKVSKFHLITKFSLNYFFYSSAPWFIGCTYRCTTHFQKMMMAAF